MSPSSRTRTKRLTNGVYDGWVMHHRLRPKRHRFVYRAFTLLLDIDRLAELDARLRLFSVDRPNLFAFYHRDHGPRDGHPLRAWIEAKLCEAGVLSSPARILLLSMPRQLGYVFNPLSIYFALDRHDRPFAIVYEVKNTFGEQHAYVLPVEPGAGSDRWIRQSCQKRFYVSPFIEADARYHFRLALPVDQLSVAIRETTRDGPLLMASLSGERRDLNDAQLLRCAVLHPLLPQKVLGGIHFEALRLWLKRIPLQPRFHLPATERPSIRKPGGPS